MDINIVGMKYNKQPYTFNRLSEAKLEYEPDNPKDPNAIRVMFDGKRIAYVSGYFRDQTKEFINSHSSYEIVPIVESSDYITLRLVVK